MIFMRTLVTDMVRFCQGFTTTWVSPAFACQLMRFMINKQAKITGNIFNDIHSPMMIFMTPNKGYSQLRVRQRLN